MTAATPMIETLAWDSHFFGKKIGRLNTALPLADKTALESFARHERYDLVQACVDTGDKDSIIALEKLGFAFVDLRLTLTHRFSNDTSPQSDTHIRLSTPADIDALKRVSHHSFTEVSRFNWQQAFTTEHIDRFYDVWLENGVKGAHDDLCFHYELNNIILGFTTIKVNNDMAGIGLIAVRAEARKQGIADALVTNVMAYARQHKLEGIYSVTQGRNIPTQKLYQKHGMQLTQSESWFYRKEWY